ncbi:MAG: DUF5067 domain-containing protein [Lachnospiraceae bacterium]|nr:DUF5067 domain-containing protein [Lachnospiraceae bacterium]
MGNEDSTTSGKTIKERTVKKKAARSIVAPTTDEEITGRESRRRESFAAMNRQPVSERESRVIKTPGGMKVREESGKGVKMVTAPIRLTWNEDTLTPSQGTTRKVQATGWPETPPAPKKSGKEMAKTKTASQGQDDNLRGQQLHQDRQQQQIRPQQQIRSQEQGRPQQPVPKRRPAPDTTGQRQPGPNGPDRNMQPVPRIPETMEALKEMTGPLPDIKEELKRSNPAQQRYMPEAVRDRQNGSLTVRPMKEGPQKGMQGQQRTITGSYGQPHSDMAGLSSVKDSNLGNTSVWNPVEQEREPLNKENKRAADGGVTVPISMRDPDRANTHTTVTNRIDREAVNEEIEHRGQRRILKTVVTTTTTTTYETVNDDDLREISAPPADTVTETVPVAKAPGPAGHPSARPGTRPAPGPGTRQGQHPQRPQNMRNPANRAGVVPGQRRPAQNRPPMPNRGNMQNTGMMQNPNGMQNTEVMQNPNGMQNTGMMQNPNGMQNTGMIQNPSGIQNTGMMNKPPADRKPMSAMDRQLADIEKALGLAPEAPTGNPAGNPAGNPVAPQPAADNIGNNTAGMGVNNINNTAARPGADQEKKQLNEDIFKGIDTFSKSPTVTIDEKTGQRNKSSEYVILAIEGVVFIIVLCICMMIYSNIRKSNLDSDIDIVKTETEETETSADEDDMTMDTGSDGLEVQEAGAGDEIMTESDVESGTLEDLTGTAASDSVDVDNDSFTLRCTNVTVVLDSDNNPAALIYFTFVNKTSKLLSMSEVFPPSVTQNGEACETSASLNEYPEEFYNKDTQISDGTSIDCCYAVSLKDAISPLQLTIHDNYETFSDIGTTEIPLQ